MGRTLISDFVADPAGNVVGGSGYEVYVYAPETTTARTCYLASTGADTLATPFTPNAGVDTTLTTQAAPADASLVVASSSGFFVGNVVPIQSGANRTEVVIKAIPDSTHLTLEAAVGGAVTYPVGSSVGGEEMTGHYQAYVDDTDNTDAVYKNTGTGKSAGRVRFNTKAPQNYQTVQDEGSALTQRAVLNFAGANVKAADNGGSARTDVIIDGFLDKGNVSGAVTVDLSAAGTQKMTATANVTGITLSNPVQGGWYFLELAEDATGGWTWAFTTTVKWQDGTAPTFATAASKKNGVTLFYDGADYLGWASTGH